jgi:hypothetical protein
MSDTDAFVAFAFILGVGITAVMALVGFSLRLRHRRRQIQHREWMAALEKGVPLPEVSRIEAGMDSARTYLLRGLIWFACGLTLTVFLVGVWMTSGNRPSLDEQIRQARDLGYTQEEIREMASDLRRRALVRASEPGFPLGLTFVGIVPAGIGIAYLVFYRAESRRERQP